MCPSVSITAAATSGSSASSSMAGDMSLPPRPRISYSASRSGATNSSAVAPVLHCSNRACYRAAQSPSQVNMPLRRSTIRAAPRSSAEHLPKVSTAFFGMLCHTRGGRRTRG
jgi:hypothetical protein